MSKYFSEMWKRHYGHGKCKVCGEHDLEYLTWHHRNPRTKHCRPTKLTSKVNPVGPWRGKWDRVNWLRAKREIDKCDLLCVWCHRVVHNTHKPKKALERDKSRAFNKFLNKQLEAKEIVQVKTYNVWSKKESLLVLSRQRFREMHC